MKFAAITRRFNCMPVTRFSGGSQNRYLVSRSQLFMCYVLTDGNRLAMDGWKMRESTDYRHMGHDSINNSGMRFSRLRFI
jgi:hypothetical protein